MKPLFIALALVLLPTTAQAEETLYMENDLPTEWTSPLTSAVNDWNKSPYVQIAVVAGDSTCYDFDYTLEFCWSTYTPTPAWIGLTSIWNDPQGNLRYAVSEANAGKSWGTAKRRFLACHELGHAMGLAHSTATSGSGCMVARFAYVTSYPARPSTENYAALTPATP